MNENESASQARTTEKTVPLLETVEVLSGENPDAAVIWLHGLGADGHDFEPAVPYFKWPGAPGIRFVFPHAPVRKVTINGGMPMRAWYDILSIDSDRGQDVAGIAQSVRQVTQLIEREVQRGIDPHRIVLAGFSQGGAIALQLGLRYPQRLAGLIALSTYLLNPGSMANGIHAANQQLPVFLAHGTGDEVVPFSMGETAHRALQTLKYAVEWHSYPMGHSVSTEEIAAISAWLQQRLA